MKKKFVNLVSVITVVVLSQACASQKNDLRAEAPSGISTEVPNIPSPHPDNIKMEAKPNSGVTTEVPGAAEIKVGDNLTKQISKIKVKDTKLKTRELSSLVSNKSTLLILVKPGCIFCESLLAVLATLQPTVKPQMIFVLDGAHATAEEFKQKYNSHSKIKALWVYDYDSKFHDELGMNSFPRLLYLDSKQTVIENQVGLVLPKDPKEQEALKKEQFPIVLQKLSETTVAWMQGLQ